MQIEVKAIDLPRVLDLNDQVLLREDWLPEGVFAELDKLRQEHHEIIAEVRNVGHIRQRLLDGYEAEDEARKAAVETDENLPEVTGSAERKDRLEEIQVLIQARINRLAEFVQHALSVINEKFGDPADFADEPGLQLPDWRRYFADKRAEADAAITAALQAKQEAEEKEAQIKGFENWFTQTVRGRGGVYLAASQVPPSLTRAEWAEDKVPESMSGTGAVN